LSLKFLIGALMGGKVINLEMASRPEANHPAQPLMPRLWGLQVRRQIFARHKGLASSACSFVRCTKKSANAAAELTMFAAPK
jgi:hypothetical protein